MPLQCHCIYVYINIHIYIYIRIYVYHIDFQRSPNFGVVKRPHFQPGLFRPRPPNKSRSLEGFIPEFNQHLRKPTVDFCTLSRLNSTQETCSHGDTLGLKNHQGGHVQILFQGSPRIPNVSSKKSVSNCFEAEILGETWVFKLVLNCCLLLNHALCFPEFKTPMANAAASCRPVPFDNSSPRTGDFSDETSAPEAPAATTGTLSIEVA